MVQNVMIFAKIRREIKKVAQITKILKLRKLIFELVFHADFRTGVRLPRFSTINTHRHVQKYET